MEKVIESREKQLLQEASEEITRLRQDNYFMRTRLKMFDDMMEALRSNSGSNGGMMSGMGEDLVWKIERHIEATSPAKESKQQSTI